MNSKKSVFLFDDEIYISDFIIIKHQYVDIQ